MEKGFSAKEEKVTYLGSELKTDKKGIAKFLKGKKFTYTLPGKKQINIFGSIVLGLNLLLAIIAIAYFKNDSFREFIFSIGR